MAWWRPKEEPSPQSRVGRKAHPTEPVPVEDASWPPEPPPSASPPQVTHPASPPELTRTVSPHVSAGPRRSFPMGIVLMLVIAVVVIGPAILAISSLVESIGEVDGVSTPDDHEGPSLVPSERFAKALDRISGQIGAEATVFVLRVAPDRIDAVVREADGKGKAIQVRADLSTTSFPTGAGGPRGLSIRRIHPAAPQRIVRAGARLVYARPRDLSYMALSVSPIDGKGMWSAFFGGAGSSSLVIAKLDGSGAYVPGRGGP